MFEEVHDHFPDLLVILLSPKGVVEGIGKDNLLLVGEEIHVSHVHDVVAPLEHVARIGRVAVLVGAVQDETGDLPLLERE